MAARPFQIDVPQAVLDDLKTRLANTRWPEPLPGAPWEHGADVAYMRDLCAYWRDSYDWRRHEAEINRWPQFLSVVDSVDIHYWHVRGTGPRPFPLILVHGWPGSIYEFHRLIGPLTDPAAHGGDPADAFDVVIPALPGYGFSGKPKDAGWGPTRMARAFDQLMTNELGYARYGTQGGDWGSIITSRMGQNHAANVAGCHLNMAGAPRPASITPEEQQFVDQYRHFREFETGYSNVQGTKPLSLGIAQSDSPAGIAAWIIEKFRTWSDCAGDVERAFTRDQLLTNIMFYWAPNSIASAANLYLEQRRDAAIQPPVTISVPVGIASFPKEISRAPKAWLEPRYNVQHYTAMPRGGHFAAMEQPELLIDDIRTFFRLVR